MFVRELLRRAGRLVLAGVLVVVCAGNLFGQGVTTSALNGFVTDQRGTALEGTVVKAVHQPSGTVYTTLVRAGGAYTIANMRIGGPYVVTAERIGYRTGSETG